MKAFTPEQAIAFYDSKKWEKLSQHQLAYLQFNQKCLCIPFDVFHAAADSLFPGIMLFGLTTIKPEQVRQMITTQDVEIVESMVNKSV